MLICIPVWLSPLPLQALVSLVQMQHWPLSSVGFYRSHKSTLRGQGNTAILWRPLRAKLSWLSGFKMIHSTDFAWFSTCKTPQSRPVCSAASAVQWSEVQHWAGRRAPQLEKARLLLNPEWESILQDGPRQATTCSNQTFESKAKRYTNKYKTVIFCV